MYTNSIALKEERKDKRRSMLFTIFFHATLIALAIIPFLSPSEPNMEDAPQAVVIDFTDFDTASKKSAKGKKAKPKPKKKKQIEKEVKKVPEVKPTPKPAPAKEPVNTTTEDNPPITPPAETKVEMPPVPEPAPVEPIEEPEEIVEPVEEEAPVAEETEATTDSDELGTAEDSGNMDDGTADSNGKADEGTTGTGEGWVDLGGDGIFNRKVVYRADVRKLTKEEGIIVIKLCISQGGSVVFAEYDEESSTIKNKALLKNTELTAKKYRFAKDYAAPYKQCGKLTFIFDLDS